MNMGKKTLQFGLLGMIAAMLAASGSADATGASDMQVAALHELYILKGDISGFRLQSRVERSNAAVYAVRLAGMEQEALKLKGDMAETGFSDVDVNDWYAPYISYAVKSGFISGYTDNTFRAEEYINEKQFVKIMLAVLGYKQDVDYEWKDVYRKAADIGLMEGPLPDPEEDREMTREGVVRYMYWALKLPRKQSSKTLIEELVDRGAVASDTADQLGLLSERVLDSEFEISE